MKPGTKSLQRADYERLIDAGTWAFIQQTESFYPSENATCPIEKQRESYDAMCRAFAKNPPGGVRVRDMQTGEVGLRIYEGENPVATVLYIHGGGFILGGLESHDDICAELAWLTGFRVMAVDYRLCPEHPHPAQFLDCRAALDRVLDEFDGNVVLAGDSAGANLAAALAHDARGRTERIKGQVLIYGAYGAARNLPSMHIHANAPLLSRADVEYYRTMRFDGAEPALDPTCDPLTDTVFSNLPPSVVIAAECDPLCDDSRAYFERLLAAGNKAALFTEPGLVHGFLRARKSVENATIGFERIVGALTALANDVWTY